MRIFKKSSSIKAASKNTPAKKIKIPKPKAKEISLGAAAPKRVELWEKVSRAIIYLLIFLVPLFFLPWTINALDYNKQALSGILIFLALLSWILKTLVSAKAELNLSRLHIPVLLLLLVYLLSSVFSLWRYGSFWGWPLNVSSGFLTLLYFAILYFLIANVLAVYRQNQKQRAQKGVFWLLFILVLSGFLAAGLGILQLFGKFLLPWDFSRVASFNTIGTVNSLAVFLAALIPLAITLSFAARKIIQGVLTLFALLMTAFLIIVNFWVAWVVLIFGAVILFIFGMSNLKGGVKSMHLLQFSIALLAIGFLFIFMNFTRISIPSLPQIPLEVSLKPGAEVNIIKSGLPGRYFLGTGPGTFVYNFSKFKPNAQEFNKTIFWNTRFGAGTSEVLDKIITTGILGILALFSVFVAFFWQGLKYLMSKEASQDKAESGDENTWFLKLGAFAFFAGTVLSQFLYPANFSLVFSFWIALAVLSAFESKRMKSWDIMPASPAAVGVSFVLVVVLIVSAGFFFVGTQKYAAEAKYLRGVKSWQESQLKTNPKEGEALLDEAVQRLEETIKLNPNLDIYWRDVSQLYLVKLNRVLQRQDIPREEMVELVQKTIGSAVNSSKQATDLNPENVANWVVRGLIYRNTIGVLGGAADWALTSYQKAGELEPANPYIFTEIGRVYVAKFDLQEGSGEENLRLAQDNFEKSLNLKPDYAPAHFQIALIYVREGELKTAAEKLEVTKQSAPLDTGLAFQLGVVYYQDNQFDKAKAEFERAVKLDRNYSNARYLLGLIYDREGNKTGAISQFEEIEKLNPGNEEIKRILENLRAGKSALEGIQPAQPPIEEKPEEIEK